MEPVQAALRARDEDGAGAEYCGTTEPHDDGFADAESSMRRLSAGSAMSMIDMNAATPRGAKEKAAEHVWSSAKRRAEDGWSSFAGKPCTDKVRILGNVSLPGTRWLCPYDFRRNLKSDLIAGCTVGVMVIPQSISYASLAGLGPIYGLYSALLPAFICEFSIHRRPCCPTLRSSCLGPPPYRLSAKLQSKYLVTEPVMRDCPGGTAR